MPLFMQLCNDSQALTLITEQCHVCSEILCTDVTVSNGLLRKLYHVMEITHAGLGPSKVPFLLKYARCLNLNRLNTKIYKTRQSNRKTSEINGMAYTWIDTVLYSKGQAQHEKTDSVTRNFAPSTFCISDP
jgi:hypothetical protein